MDLHKIISENISRVGWHCTGVGGDQSSPSFAYTIGLTERGLPEFLMCGVPMHAAHSFFHSLIKKIDEEGEIADGFVTRELTQSNFPLAVRRIPVEALGHVNREYVIQAMRHYDRLVDVNQLIWSCPEGKFPWEPNNFPKHSLQCGPYDWVKGVQ